MKQTNWHINLQFIEQGDIYFFYKPKKAIQTVKSIEDISRFYLVLEPYSTSPRRFIVIGKKRLPPLNDGGVTGWGYIEKVGGRGFLVTTPQKENRSTQNRSARPAGEGVYSLVRHFDHTHFVYTLELPQRLGAVQAAFNIKRKASYIFNMKNIKAIDSWSQSSPRRSGEKPLKKAVFVPANPTGLREGNEILLTGVASNFDRLSISVEKEPETPETAEVFQRLKLDKNRHHLNPLIKGSWE